MCSLCFSFFVSFDLFSPARSLALSHSLSLSLARSFFFVRFLSSSPLSSSVCSALVQFSCSGAQTIRTVKRFECVQCTIRMDIRNIDVCINMCKLCDFIGIRHLIHIHTHTHTHDTHVNRMVSVKCERLCVWLFCSLCVYDVRCDYLTRTPFFPPADISFSFFSPLHFANAREHISSSHSLPLRLFGFALCSFGSVRLIRYRIILYVCITVYMRVLGSVCAILSAHFYRKCLVFESSNWNEIHS